MKVLYLNLPHKFNISRASRWPEKTKSETLYYPYWLAYSAGYTLEKGFDVNLVDCIVKKLSTEQTVELAVKYNPDYIVTEITTPTCFDDYEVIKAIKNALPNTVIAVGGTHATALSEQVLKECDGIDIIMRQEYDHTVVDILQNKNLNEILGITYRTKENGIVKNNDRKSISDLDELPFVSTVYERFLNVNDYCYAFARHPMIQIFSSRGCPFKCNFCSYPETMGGRLLRKRSVKNFVDEIEYICKKMPHIQEIFFEDDTFTVDKNRVVEICDEIIKRGLKPVWSCNTRADLPYEVMKKMKQAGCRLLVVGYESGSQEVLNETQKGISLEQSLEFSKNTKKLGIKVFGCFMIGLKGDNLTTIEQTFNFGKKTYADMVFFQQAVPFPGTKFYEWVKESGYLITEDYSKWLNKDGYLNCLVNYPYATAEQIEKIRDNLMSRYYFSFTYIVKTFLKNFSIVEFKRVFKAGTAYIVFRIKKMNNKK